MTWPLVAYFCLIASSSSGLRPTSMSSNTSSSSRPSVHGGPGGAALVEDRHRGAVGLGLADRVAVDEVAEDLVGLRPWPA